MKIIEITASFSQTVQLRQYEPINLYASVKVELDENEDVRGTYAKCFKLVKTEVNERIKLVKKIIK